MEWFYAQNNRQLGPVTTEALISMLRQGVVLPSDLVWREGMAEWAPASSVSELFPPARSEPIVVGYLNPLVPASNTPVYAGFWLRLLAYVLDIIPILIATSVISYALNFLNLSGIDVSFRFLEMILGWLYYGFMESTEHQATLGKMAMGIRVTDMEGRRISFGRATGRYFGMLISAFFLCGGFLIVAWTSQKQALHDIMAGCLVVKNP